VPKKPDLSKEFLRPREVAALRCTTLGTLAQERFQRPYRGPPFIRDSRRVLYPRAALYEWLAARLVTPSLEPRRHRGADAFGDLGI
jgi:hypothetical protein